MTASDVVRRLHQHRIWANYRLLASARSVDEERLREPFAIGQGTLWRRLCHLYAAEYVWLEALLGHESPLVVGDLPGRLPGNQEGQGGPESLDDLGILWRKLDERWESYLAELRDEELDRQVFKVSSLTGARQGTRRGDVLLHVCMHAQYTTAQGVNMLRQLGAPELPDVMLISLARTESQPA